jgi:hypothetical protein
MRRVGRILGTAIVAGVLLTGCRPVTESSSRTEPAKVEAIGATGLSRLTLTAQAVGRLGITTVAVGQLGATSVRRSVVPYSAVIYDNAGKTWVYTNPEPLVFVRHAIIVDSISGPSAVLTDGPPIGTSVVTIGSALLYGAEFGVGK